MQLPIAARVPTSPRMPESRSIAQANAKQDGVKKRHFAIFGDRAVSDVSLMSFVIIEKSSQRHEEYYFYKRTATATGNLPAEIHHHACHRNPFTVSIGTFLPFRFD